LFQDDDFEKLVPLALFKPCQ